MDVLENDLADKNRGVFDSPEVVRGFREWTSDFGEVIATLAIAEDVRGKPILDIGIGGGRTTWILRLLSSEYTGIDFAANMIAAAKASFPDADLRVGDARDLSAFDDASFALVTFSANGLDAVNHDDRAVALKEFARVVRDDGYVMYSTHNRRGPSYGERPWQLRRPGTAFRVNPKAIARSILAFPFRLKLHATAYRSYFQNRPLSQDNGTWAIASLRAHQFRPVIHFITLEGILSELDAAGLVPVLIVSLEGEIVDFGSTSSNTHYFHVIAKRRSA